MDTYPPATQRLAPLALATALSSATTALRRDECGDWRIGGTAGHVYACLEGFQLIKETVSGRGWGAAKRRLAFATLQRDGDTEGAFVLDRRPNAIEAAEMRMVSGVRKGLVLSPTTSTPWRIASRPRRSLRRTRTSAPSCRSPPEHRGMPATFPARHH